MDRFKWMYQMKRMEPQYLVHVWKFVAAAKAHCERLDRATTICPCSHCKNMKAHKDNEVQSHLIRYGFIKDYTVWTFHGEKVVDATVGDASVDVVDDGQSRACRITTCLLIGASNKRRQCL
jgi:hypothetical protein